jgi:hypothetical protein
MSMTQPTPPVQETEEHLENLARLHRMSRTAGLGTTDYAAINVPAVITAVLGAASILALFDTIFLIIPVIGLLIGMISLRQIGKSGGTQTGYGIAGLGLSACLFFSAFTGFKLYQARIQYQTDVEALTALVRSFGDKIAAEDYPQAYQLLDARFRDRVSRDQFEQFFQEKMKPYVGKMLRMESNGHFFIDVAADDPSIRMAQGICIVDLEKNPGGEPFRVDVTFRYAAGEWKVFNIAAWFPVQQPSVPTGS